MHPISSSLLSWYDVHARVLPWRGIRNPYQTWVSETMLQQTRVETVIPYFHRFLAAFPTLSALASAPEEEVLKLWEGLGYYSRARNLWLGAQQVMREFEGTLPADPVQLQSIRGIGPYTSRAIASIAFGVPVPAVDGNVIRVVSRLFGIRENPLQKEVRERVEQIAGSLVPPERPGDYNQAVMDLGATICVPGTPDCDRCPLSVFCDAYRTGDEASLPLLPVARPPREINYDLLILFSGPRVLLRRRTEKLLQGLWCFPLLEGHHPAEVLPALVKRKLHLAFTDFMPAGKARHVFTHQIWRMNLYICRAEQQSGADMPAPDGYNWIDPADFSTIAIPTAMKAAVQAVSGKS